MSRSSAVPRPVKKGRWRSGAAAAALLSLQTVATSVHAQAPNGGQLIAGVRRDPQVPHVAELIDVASGARRVLPLGHRTRGAPDTWSASLASAHVLLRADDVGDVDFFDSRTLEPLGGFSLESMPGVHRPEFLGTPRLSPDGRYVLAWWLRNVNRFEPELTVFDRQGRVLQEAVEPSEHNRGFTGAAAWTSTRPGRYVRLDDDGIYVCQLGTPRCLFAPWHLPSRLGVRGTQIAVSPDGLHLAMVLGQSWPDTSGEPRSHSVLFTSKLDGTDLRQLTMPSREMQASGTDDAPVNPQWSPDGRRIAFTPRGKNPYAAVWYYDSCSEIRVVDAHGGMQEVGAALPQHGLLMAGGKPVTICSTMEWVD